MLHIGASDDQNTNAELLHFRYLPQLVKYMHFELQFITIELTAKFVCYIYIWKIMQQILYSMTFIIKFLRNAGNSRKPREILNCQYFK